MKLHILGIGGTFMGSLAILAKKLGHDVEGSDAHIYPPMSEQLQSHSIVCYEGYHPAHLQDKIDLVIIGNALSRGNLAVEYVLNQGITYISGAQWLSDHVLPQYWTIAVAGTHGKTTTSSMVAWILEFAGLQPSFLIGGVPLNFGVSARLEKGQYFVIEADEYDTAFFDKRSKFVHYRPRTAILNNLEYDHADIFSDIAAIQKQFHHLIRTIPSEGSIICNAADKNLEETLKQGYWTPVCYFNDSKEWTFKSLTNDGSHFEVYFNQCKQGEVKWQLLGEHNQLNALAAIAAVQQIGISPTIACQALQQFQNVKRRLEIICEKKGIVIYDDFAHHPTAIATTLTGLRENVKKARIFVVLEARSNTMKLGIHREQLSHSLHKADKVFVFQPPSQTWQFPTDHHHIQLFQTTDDLLHTLIKESQSGDHIVIMSNGGFENIHQRLLNQL
ncbi:MAG: UDP-N-acetylmuramate:L-alanyl-gamma-D-glutamyl-meso-diaminopimelate ligase [Pseudomonadota bacterium]|jgi:UDP-N-acetylmuramate: L-alanyl-gamma-D-glutamyl-meso-diaminopimelate ligase